MRAIRKIRLGVLVVVGAAAAAMGQCDPPTDVVVIADPSSGVICENLGSASLSLSIHGDEPFSYQWQWRPGPSDLWIDVVEGYNPVPGGGAYQFYAHDPRSGTLTVLPTGDFGTAGWHWDHRCVVTNDCGTGESNSITLRLHGADFNHDGDVGTDSDIAAFFACLGGNCCEECDSADFNGDGDLGTDADIESFFRALSGESC